MRGTLGSAVRGGIGGGALGAVAGLGGGMASTRNSDLSQLSSLMPKFQ